MAGNVQKVLFVARDDLRDGYKGVRGDIISSLCKAIAKATQTKVESQLMPNGTVKFEVIGGRGGVNKAKRNIVGQFCKESTKAKYIDAPKETVIRSSQEAMKLLPEPEQLKLLNEGNRFLLTEAALNKFNFLTGASELREFACASCDHFWWRVVPKTKPVSRCKKCSERYDALPRDKEFGIGRYLCTECGHSFNKRCTATDTFFCYSCKSEVRTPYIHPKLLYTPPPPPKHPLPQTLYVPPPQMRPLAPKPSSLPYVPKSQASPVSFKKKRVIHASTPHVSTGSTISTILTQTEYSEYEFMSFSDSDESDDEDYPASTGTSEAVDITDTEYNSDTETMVGSDFDSEHSPPVTRKRISASDTESDVPDSDADQDSSKIHVHVPTTPGSDSGIGSATVSSSRSSAHSTPGSYASVVKGSSMEAKHEFPGVVFSKSRAQQTVDRRGAIIAGEGIILTVPKGAVPSTDKVEISLQGCLGGPFVPPDDYTFASPVFLISPPFAFHKEVVLWIDHFACLETEEDCQDMIFISSQTQPTISSRGEPSWHFHQYHHYGNPKFSPHSGYGEIHLKHFCFAGFARKRKRGTKDWYCISLYTPVTYGLSLCHAIFSVTLHHEVYTENLERYLDKNFKNETFRPVCKIVRSDKLEEEIQLNIPSTAQGYRIVPDSDPCKITKDEIDYGLECKKRAIKDIAMYPPRIVLRIYIDQPSLDLECPLEVSGIASTPPLKFNLLVNPTSQSDYSSQSSMEGSTCSERGDKTNGSEDEPLEEKHLPTISRYLNQVSKSDQIRLGGALGLSFSKLLTMQMMPEEMVAAWIHGEDNSLDPSWSVLVKALKEIGQTGVARKIRKEQLQKRT